MRYKKRNLIARRIKILPIKFVKKDMTTYSGLMLIDYYLRIYNIHQRLRKSMKDYDFTGDYSIGDLLFMVLIMIMIGAERLSHIEYLKTDPLFSRVVRLTRIPHRTKLSTALKQFTSDSLKALIELNSQLVVEKLQELGLYDITIDLDGTVISTRGNPSWSFKGYNPIKRGANSYFPLTAHIGETGHFLSIINRPGNVHDSNRALSVIKTIIKQLQGFSIRFRADSAFCVPDVINYLLLKDISFAIKAPFWRLNDLKSAVKQRERWFIIDKRWSYFWVKQPIDSIEGEHYVMILRKQVKKTKKPYQLKLFSPNDGNYEYSAIATDTKKWNPKELLDFVSGRSGQEKSIGELKTNFAFDHIPTNTYQANSAYMQISQMAYNLAISMQSSMGLSKNHKSNKKRTRTQKTMGWKTFKFLILNRAGRINKENGAKVLEVTKNPATKLLYENIVSSLNQVKLKKAA
jgi:hypothetical protein